MVLLGNPRNRPDLGKTILTLRHLHHPVLVAALAAAFATGVCHAAPELELPNYSPGEILLAQRAIADTVSAPQPAPSPIPESSVPREAKEPATKSTGKAFFMNLLVPGTGHLYAGNKRGWIHLGLECATWVTYFYYHDRGMTKEDEYQAFADAKWDSLRYFASDTYQADEWQTIRNFIAAGNMQQYYEDIGKLPYYWTGWEGYEPYPQAGGDAGTRLDYYGMRSESNNYLKNARYALVGGFVNRIVSAVDILRILRNSGKAKLGEDTTIKFNMRTKPFSNDNALKITVTRKLG